MGASKRCFLTLIKKFKVFGGKPLRACELHFVLGKHLITRNTSWEKGKM